MALVDYIRFQHLGRGHDFQAYLAALQTGHDVSVSFYTMDADETHVHEISAAVTAGQVDLDTSRDPARWLQFTILDPEYRIAFADPHSPHRGGLWAGSVVQVWYAVFVPGIGSDGIGAWVDCPVFTGPVQTLQRNSQQVDVQCQGKELYLLPPNSYQNVFGKAQSNAKSRSREHALSALLDAVGEPQNVRWDAGHSNLPKSFDALKRFHGGGDSYLKVAKDMVGDQNIFFYDGHGKPCVRRQKHDVTFDLTGMELTAAAESFDMSKVRNRARATVQHQPTHKGGKQPPPVTVIERLRVDEVMSAQNLGRSGVDRYIDEKSGTSYKTNADAKNAATHMLHSGTSEDATLDILPVPFLNPYDHVKVTRPTPVGSDAPAQTIRLQVKSFSLPLHVGDGMSLGYTRRVLDPKHAKARFLKKKPTHKHGK